MKNIQTILSTFIVMATVTSTLAGCSSGWNQDPLAKKDGVLRDGQQKPTEPEAPKAIDSNSVLLDHPDFYAFREEVPGEFKLEGRILLPGYKPTVIIENLSDFPGARFDAAAGKFSWTPARGTVSGDTGLNENRILKVLVVGEKAGEQKVVRRNFSLKLEVGKVLNAPDIFSISGSTIDVREGGVSTINVQVRDLDAGKTPDTWPTIQAWPLLGYTNISQFVTITNMLATGKNEYSVTLKIDLTDAELTKSKDRFGFSLQAISRFQQGSVKKSVYVNVLTALGALQSTWFDVLEFALGVKDEQQFLIFDPKDEALISTPTFTGVPAGATFTCSGVGISRQLCKMQWSPDFMATAGDFTVKANVVLRNQDPSDTQTKNQTFDLRMKVNSAPPINPVSVKGGH